METVKGGAKAMSTSKADPDGLCESFPAGAAVGDGCGRRVAGVGGGEGRREDCGRIAERHAEHLVMGTVGRLQRSVPW